MTNIDRYFTLIALAHGKSMSQVSNMDGHNRSYFDNMLSKITQVSKAGLQTVVNNFKDTLLLNKQEVMFASLWMKHPVNLDPSLAIESIVFARKEVVNNHVRNFAWILATNKYSSISQMAKDMHVSYQKASYLLRTKFMNVKTLKLLSKHFEVPLEYLSVKVNGHPVSSDIHLNRLNHVLFRLRTSNNLSQRKISKAFHVNYHYISHLESTANLKITPRFLTTLLHYSLYFNVPFYSLLKLTHLYKNIKDQPVITKLVEQLSYSASLSNHNVIHIYNILHKSLDDPYVNQLYAKRQLRSYKQKYDLQKSDWHYQIKKTCLTHKYVISNLAKLMHVSRARVYEIINPLNHVQDSTKHRILSAYAKLA